ncbi:MAG: phytoene/squalene synthase family protein [Candidatus Coatesbacteria bacterium]|nr:MAG: phytoene/squalene synthase family protein [Candidatus Coatesbacteria bacterium]
MAGLVPLPGNEGTFDEALRTCEEIAAKDRSNLYVVSQFIRDRCRYEAFTAMYSVMRVIDDLVDDVPNVGALSAGERARMEEELERWQGRIEAAYAGNPGPEPSDIALASALAAFPVPRSTWSNFISAMRYDLRYDRFETWDSFLEYAEGATAAPTTIYIYLLCAQPVDGTSEGNVRYEVAESGDGFDCVSCGRELGIFAYLAHILRDVVKDLQIGETGRIYIPASDLADAGLSEDEFRSLVRSGSSDRLWDELVTSVVQRARRFERAGVSRARSRFPAMEPDCRFILALIIGLYQDILARIEADPASVLSNESASNEEDLPALVRRAAEEAAYIPPGYEDLY